MFRVVIRLLALIVCSLLSATLAAQQFSADMVDLRPEGRPNKTKIYVNNDKVRLESQSAEGGDVVAMIWDEANKTRYMLMPSRHMYMDYSPVMAAKMPMYMFWHPSDINNACPEWQKMMEQMKNADKWGTCRKVGSDTVNGRSTVKYEGTNSEGKSGQIWIDSKLRWLSKVQSDDGGMELRNIQEGSQPSSLFEVPAGYQKLDYGKMGQRPR